MLFKIFLLECSWFTMLCLPQVYSKVNQWYICICFHPFLKDSFPIKAITEYWVGFPVLYSRFLLVIYFIYSSVYMSVPIFQFIHPDNIIKFVFYIHDYFCFINKFIYTLLLYSTYKWYHRVFVSLRLTYFIQDNNL